MKNFLIHWLIAKIARGCMQDGQRTVYQHYFRHQTGFHFKKGIVTSIPCHRIYVVCRQIKHKVFALIKKCALKIRNASTLCEFNRGALRSSNKPEDDRYKRLNIISPDRPQKKSHLYSSPNLKSQEELHCASEEINFSHAPETVKGKRAAKHPLVFKTDGRDQCQENLEVSGISEMDLEMTT